MSRSEHWSTHAEGIGHRSLRALLAVGVCSALLLGCTSQQGPKDIFGLSQSLKNEQDEGDSFASTTDEAEVADAGTAQPLETDKTVTGSVDAQGQLPEKPARSVEQIATTVSASCRRILAEAGIETTMLRSPNIDGVINSQQDLSIGASYDIFDLRRANIKEELGLVQCAREDALAKIAQLLNSTDSSLSRAGYRAQANQMSRSAPELAAINRSIKNNLRAGNITRFRASALTQSIQRLEAETARAQGEADKRRIAERIRRQSFAELDKRLMHAEQRIQQLESSLRSADAVKLRATVRYAKSGENSRDITISRDGEIRAKLAVSMRLGAYTPRRYQLEEIAEEARNAALFEPDRGVLWRSDEFAQVSRQIVRSLNKERSKVAIALQDAQRTAEMTASNDQPDMLAANLKARIDAVRLRAELAGIEATIADNGNLGRKLTFQQ